MKKRNYVIPAIIAVTAAIAGTIYATGASASWGKGPGNMSANLAEKLGVDQSKVNEAMDSIREEHRAERQAEVSANLEKAVSDGAITAEQKDKLLAKHEEMRTKRDAMRTELEQWYSENGIDADKLQEYGFRGGMGRGMGGGYRGGR